MPPEARRKTRPNSSASCVYSSAGAARLRCSGRRACVLALLGFVLTAVGGCSASYQLGGLTADEDSLASDTTGSLKAPIERADTEADLAYAKSAATELLRQGSHDASLPWENPHTSARGTITLLASDYEREGVACRDFLASHLRRGRESWFRGTACRRNSAWEVRELRVLRRI